MLYVSCRKNFDDVNEWSPAPLVQWDDGTPHPLSEEPNYLSTRLVQVHGYNCQASNVMDAYRANTVMVAEADCLHEGSHAGFLWPGLGANFIESLELHRAQGHADASAGYLATFLKQIAAPPVVMTHSLGARVALEAARKYGAKMKALVLTGPAVDDDCMTKVYSEIQPLVNKVLVVWSKKDPVLANAYKFDQFHEALGHDGPRVALPWVESMDLSAEVDTHGGYRFSRKMWRRVVELL